MAPVVRLVLVQRGRVARVDPLVQGLQVRPDRVGLAARLELEALVLQAHLVRLDRRVFLLQGRLGHLVPLDHLVLLGQV